MKYGFVFLLLIFTLSSKAANWVTLNENSTSKLMLDKQSILQQNLFKKAWVKIEYKVPQQNQESLGKEYNLSKLLWFFDCKSQKSSTSQVFQYLDDELVYSAGVDSKNAEFIEPVPESEVDIAMHHVCLIGKPAVTSTEIKPAVTKANTSSAKPDDSAKKPETKSVLAVNKPAEPTAKIEIKPEISTSKVAPARPSLNKDKANKVHWTYEGKEGPENWAKLSPEFTACEIGRNQSPINIENTMSASLKPIRGIQKFPAKDISNNGHTVQVNFKEGNMLVLDSTAYQMKQVHFHAPSENRIHDKSFPLEAHFVHSDSKGNLTVIGVMFKEGAANLGLAKLWAQIPNKEDEPVVLKNRVIPSELMPENRSYYRYSGSLTTPPCTEGVRWIIMKTPMTASKEQIEAFKHAINHSNNRPVQALNGRLIAE